MRIDSEQNCLVFEDNDNLKIKKIGGHAFVELLGLNSYKTIGDALLELHGVVKSEVDEKYLLRGDIAETIIKKVYERDGHHCVTYDKKQIKHDNFQNVEYFGGLIDIELPVEQTLIEVKSKSMNKYEEINNHKPQDEIFQAFLYGYLRGYKSIIMEWVFFDEKTEKEIFEKKPITSFKDLKKIKEVLAVPSNMVEYMYKVLNIVQEFRKTRKISLDAISDEYLKKLGFERPSGIENIINTLPF